MITAWASFSCAANETKTLMQSCQGDLSLLADLMLHLTVAAAYSEAYEKIYHSIYWNHAKAATKRGIKDKLRRLVFDAYTSLVEAERIIEQLPYKTEDELFTIWSSIRLAKTTIETYHQSESQWKQLSLF